MSESIVHEKAALEISIDSAGNKSIELRTTLISLKKEGWMCIHYKSNSEIDKKDKEIQHKAFLEITNNKKYPVIVTAGDKVSFTKEAIEYGKQIEPEQPFIAVVVVTHKLAYRLVADFYYWFHKPLTPYKVLAKEADAINWFFENGFLKR